MINIDTTDNQKWRNIEKCHVLYMKRLIIESVKRLEEANDISSVKKLIKKDLSKNDKTNWKKISTKLKDDLFINAYKMNLNKISDFLSIKTIRNLSIGNKNELLKLNHKYTKAVNSITIPDIQKKYIKNMNKNIIKAIFNYTDHFAKAGFQICINEDVIRKWNRNELLNMIDLRVCPYCNRQYITSFIDNKEDVKINRTTAEGDHYYPKSDYPLLALSLYNIIPSCHVCNSVLKGNKVGEVNTLYPYDNENISKKMIFRTDFGRTNDGKFDCSIYYNSISPNLVINICTYGEEAAISKKVFHLSEVYQTHKMEVSELINRMITHKDKQLLQLQDITEGRISVSEMKNNYFDFDEKDLGKKPLSKLKSDIFNSFKKYL